MDELKVIYDWKGDKKPTCCLCECQQGVHILFWKCPLFMGEDICGECCQVDALRPNVAEKFSEKLGRPISLEEINEQCRQCGKNYAKQNEDLANKTEGGFNGGQSQESQGR